MTDKTPLPFGFPLEGIPLAGDAAKAPLVVTGTMKGVDVILPSQISDALITGPTITSLEAPKLTSGSHLAGAIATPATVSGLPVAGYKPQNGENVAVVNRNKELEERVLRQIDKHKSAGQSYDQRFVALAQTYIQVGFMLLNRSVFQPERIALPEDAA